MRIITNADDFGQDDDTVAATIECFERGALTSATIMPNMPATEHAIEFARRRPNLSFGVHLTFVRENESTLEAPISPLDQIPDLVDANGRCLPSNTLRWRALLNRVSIPQIEKEIAAQIESLRDRGVALSHVDSHGHLHKFAPFREALHRTLARYNIDKVRSAQDVYLVKPLKSPTYWFGGSWRRKLRVAFQTTDHFFMPAGGDKQWPEKLLDITEGGTLEVGVHPGHAEPWRKIERAAILAFAAQVVSRGHTLIGWKAL